MVGGGADAGVLRPVAVRRLLALESRGELTAGHRRMVADTLAVSERTVRRWLVAARVDGRLERAERRRFTLTPKLARRLAFHRGSVAALHRELAGAMRQWPVGRCRLWRRCTGQLRGMCRRGCGRGCAVVRLPAGIMTCFLSGLPVTVMRCGRPTTSR